MAALDTVQDYLTVTRTILQDKIEPYRYTDEELVTALNLAFTEVRRLRPDAVAPYLRKSLPAFTTSNLSAKVDMDPQLRTSLMYYMAGHAHLRDNDDAEGSRAAALLNKFVSQLLTIQS